MMSKHSKVKREMLVDYVTIVLQRYCHCFENLKDTLPREMVNISEHTF